MLGEIPDANEIGEACAEAWAMENTREESGEMQFLCPICGEWETLAASVPSSRSPTALPLCAQCADLCERAKSGDEEARKVVVEMTARAIGGG